MKFQNDKIVSKDKQLAIQKDSLHQKDILIDKLLMEKTSNQKTDISTFINYMPNSNAKKLEK